MNVQTMTIKELAAAAGCSPKTVNRVLKEFYPNLLKNGRTTRFTKSEAFDVMAKLPKKNDLGQPRTKAGKVVQGNDQVKTIAQTVVQTLVEMGIIPAPKHNPPGSLPALDARSEINRLIRQYSEATKTAPQNLWNRLYNEALYRMHRNYKLLANNKGVPAIQIVEEDQRLDELLSIARLLFDMDKFESTVSFLKDIEDLKQ